METVAVGGKAIFEFLGLHTPLMRFLATTAIGTGLEFYAKPNYAFDENGDMLPWSMLSSEPGATYTPPGFYPGLAGLATALFI